MIAATKGMIAEADRILMADNWKIDLAMTARFDQENIRGDREHLRMLKQELKRTHAVIERGALAYIVSRWILDGLDQPPPQKK